MAAKQNSGLAYRSIDQAYNMEREDYLSFMKDLDIDRRIFLDEAGIDAATQKGMYPIFQKRFTSREAAERLDEERSNAAKEDGDDQAREGRGDDGKPTFGRYGLQNVMSTRSVRWLRDHDCVPITMIDERKPGRNSDADVRKAEKAGRKIKKGRIKRADDGKTIVWKYCVRVRWVSWNDENDRPGETLTLQDKIGIITKDSKENIEKMLKIVSALEELHKKRAFENCHVWENKNATATINFTRLVKGTPKTFDILAFESDGSFRGTDMVSIKGQEMPLEEAVKKFGAKQVDEHGKRYKVAPRQVNKLHPDYQAPPSLRAGLEAKLNSENGDKSPPAAS